MSNNVKTLFSHYSSDSRFSNLPRTLESERSELLSVSFFPKLNKKGFSQNQEKPAKELVLNPSSFLPTTKEGRMRLTNALAVFPQSTHFLFSNLSDVQRFRITNYPRKQENWAWVNYSFVGFFQSWIKSSVSAPKNFMANWPFFPILEKRNYVSSFFLCPFLVVE